MSGPLEGDFFTHTVHFNFSPHFAYSQCHFHWAPMKNKACSLRDL